MFKQNLLLIRNNTVKTIYERGKKMFEFLLERWDLKDTAINSPEFMKKFLIEKVNLKD